GRVAGPRGRLRDHRASAGLALARAEGGTMKRDVFGARGTLRTGQGEVVIHRLAALERAGLAPGLSRLPFSIKILLESVLRNLDGELVIEADVKNLAAWGADTPKDVERPFMPARVILQDFTGVPSVV